MDPLTASISIILGKYALDKGLELAKEVGPKALDVAKEMYQTTLDHLRKDPAGEVIAGEFEKTPEVYQKPVEQKLDEAVKADPDFAALLKELKAAYDAAAKEHAGSSYQAALSGEGAIAQGAGASATAATGKGAVAIGSVGGDVNMGKEDKS